MLLTDLPALVPVPPSRAPGKTIPVYSRSESLTAFDPSFATPYTQNLTLTVNRSLGRYFNMEVRYVGALSRKSPGFLDLNTPTVYQNKELFDAFAAARRGENPVLLDQLLAGLDLAGTGNTDLDHRRGLRDLPDRQFVRSCRHVHGACEPLPASKLLPCRVTPAVPRARSSTPVRNTSATRQLSVAFPDFSAAQ